MRLVFLDTETTGLSPHYGHRIVEIACVEVVDGQLTGRELHHLINPGRPIPPEVSDIHGIRDEMLQDKPGFAGIAEELMQFVGSDKAVMHNSRFDVSFLQSEFKRLEREFPPLTQLDAVIDTLSRFRILHPGLRCNLSALCERHGVELSEGESWHGALADARMLARLWRASGLMVC